MTITHVRTQVEPLGFKYTVRIDRVLDEPENWQEEIATIRQAGEGDVIHLLLNTQGGNAYVMYGLLSALEQSTAHIICELEGMAASCGSFIFLCGDEFRVSPNAELMAHNASHGIYGKASDVSTYVNFSDQQFKKLLERYYTNFFTQEEITKMVDGKEFYMDSDEIMDRLEKRAELMQESEDTAGLLGDEEPCDLSGLSLRELKGLAKESNIKFPHNISKQKLLGKLTNIEGDGNE